jgi:hypothetical protein
MTATVKLITNKICCDDKKTIGFAKTTKDF